jgi:hypothetical protein
VNRHDEYSLRAYRGWRTRREGKTAETPRCPACGEPMPKGALDHEKRRHVDLYARKAHKRGELV